MEGKDNREGRSETAYAGGGEEEQRYGGWEKKTLSFHLLWGGAFFSFCAG